MIIPSNKLVLSAGVLVPVALFAGFFETARILALGFYSLLGIMALWDATHARSSHSHIRMILPSPVRLTRHASGQVTLQLTHPGQCAIQIRVALAWPESIHTNVPLQTVTLPEDVTNVEVHWPCTPHERGLFTLPQGVLEWPSRWRLWHFRNTVNLNTEIRVSPDMVQDRGFLQTYFIQNNRSGLHQHRLLGKGREFEKLREYMQGDCFGDIHWKATAKRQMPMTKEFQIERTQEVYLVIDASRLSAQCLPQDTQQPDTHDDPLLERYITSATLFSQVCLRQGDHFGLITFSDRIHHFFKAQTSKSHHLACRNALLALEPRLVMPDYAEVFSWIRTRIRKRALFILLTDLRDPIQAQAFEQGVTMIAKHHLALVTMIQPKDLAPLFEHKIHTAEDIPAHLSHHIQWHALVQHKQTLNKQGIAFHMIPSETLAVHMVHEYMHIKKRQVL